MLRKILHLAIIGFCALPLMATAQSSAPDLPVFPGTTTPTPPALPTLPSRHPAAMPASSVPVPVLPAPVVTPPAAVPVPPTPIALPTTSVLPVPAAPPPKPLIPAPITPPPSAAAPPLLSSATPAVMEEIQKKNPDLLMAPVSMGTKSMIFPKADMDVVVQLLQIYDTTDNTPKQVAAPAGNDDLNSLLKELTAKKDDKNVPAAVVVTLPNVYLGSIVYYSPSHWSVWINDRKFVNSHNEPTSEYYITRISRTQVEIVWRPSVLLDMADKWKQRTDNGKQPMPNIEVNAAKGTVTLLMHTNQTFLPRSLAIQEGLIKSGGAAAAPAEAGESNP